MPMLYLPHDLQKIICNLVLLKQLLHHIDIQLYLDTWCIHFLNSGFRVWMGWNHFLFGLDNRNMIWQRLLRSKFALRIPRQHNFSIIEPKEEVIPAHPYSEARIQKVDAG